MVQAPQKPSMDSSRIFPSIFQSIFINIFSGPFAAVAKKFEFESIIKPSIVEEVSLDDDYDDIEDDSFLDEFENEDMVNDEGYFEDAYFEEEAEPSVRSMFVTGVSSRCTNGNLTFGFDEVTNPISALGNHTFGSATMMDIENFSTEYRARLKEAESAGSIPENIVLEVSSPGIERIVRIPQDLVRFKERNMHVNMLMKHRRLVLHLRMKE